MIYLLQSVSIIFFSEDCSVESYLIAKQEDLLTEESFVMNAAGISFLEVHAKPVSEMRCFLQ